MISGQQSCRHPVSKVDRCMDSTQIAFRFANCPAEQLDDRGIFRLKLIYQGMHKNRVRTTEIFFEIPALLSCER